MLPEVRLTSFGKVSNATIVISFTSITTAFMIIPFASYILATYHNMDVRLVSTITGIASFIGFGGSFLFYKLSLTSAMSLGLIFRAFAAVLLCLSIDNKYITTVALFLFTFGTAAIVPALRGYLVLKHKDRRLKVLATFK